VEVLVLSALILTNGLLAMSEVALLTSRRAKLQAMAGRGRKSAAIALRVSENPTEFLSAIQIGITSIGLLSGIVGEAVFAKPLALVFQRAGLEEGVASVGATIVVVVIVTYFAITVGELVPKRLGQTHPEVIASLVSAPLLVIAKVSRPFVFVLSVTTNALLRLFGVKGHTPSAVTEEEIEALLDEGSLSGLIEAQERDILRNLFRLDERRLGSLMVPRSEILFLDVSAPDKTNFDLIAESPHSRIPVCDGGLDNVLGVLTAKAALAAVARGKSLSLTDDLEEAVYVPETLTGMSLLEQFREHRYNFAFVVDEYGGLEGIVTLQDILDALVGEIGNGVDSEPEAVQRDDGSWLLESAMAIPTFKDTLGIESVPDELLGKYHTVSGLVLLLLGRLPKPGDSVVVDSWRLEVIDLDGRRIDKVLASRIPAAPFGA
jgi:putative hemolysin